MSVIGYRFVSDQAFSEKQRDMVLADTNMREVMNMLTENEIRDVINNKLNNISNPVKIIFSNTICLDCGEEGDVR